MHEMGFSRLKMCCTDPTHKWRGSDASLSP